MEKPASRGGQSLDAYEEENLAASRRRAADKRLSQCRQAAAMFLYLAAKLDQPDRQVLRDLLALRVEMLISRSLLRD